MLRFNQYDQVIQATLAGQGLALGRLELLQPQLDGGQLARADIACTPVASPNSYWLVQAEKQPREDIARVARWIQSEAAGLRREARRKSQAICISSRCGLSAQAAT